MASQNTASRPYPADYRDYRNYLQQMVAYLKATHPRFSYRYFSRLAGYSSPNFLKLVAEGHRNMSIKSIAKFARGLTLDPREAEAFEALVLFNEARTEQDRTKYLEQLEALQKGQGAQSPLHESEYRVHSLWYAIPIRELMEHPDFREDPEWIGARLTPHVRSSDVKYALQLLQEVGLVRRDPYGRLRPAADNTNEKTRDLALRNFHRSMLELAAQTLERPRDHQLEVTALTASLSRAQYDDVCRQVDAFRNELFAKLSQQAAQERHNPDREVYQIGFQIFPLTDRKG